MIPYKIVHHVRGRIRVKVPLLKTLPLADLGKLSSIPVAPGILEISPSFLGETVVITYDPEKIDILDYLRTIASDPEVERLINGASR